MYYGCVANFGGNFGSGKSVNAVGFSAATVTETAILRSKMEDLERLVTEQAELLAAQQAEIQGLRRQVVALRGGVRLAEEP